MAAVNSSLTAIETIRWFLFSPTIDPLSFSTASASSARFLRNSCCDMIAPERSGFSPLRRDSDGHFTSIMVSIRKITKPISCLLEGWLGSNPKVPSAWPQVWDALGPPLSSFVFCHSRSEMCFTNLLRATGCASSARGLFATCRMRSSKTGFWNERKTTPNTHTRRLWDVRRALGAIARYLEALCY